jgi:hypothetical protein
VTGIACAKELSHTTRATAGAAVRMKRKSATIAQRSENHGFLAADRRKTVHDNLPVL